MYTQTAAAAPTATPSSTRDFGTLQFMDLLSTPTPVGTAGVNLACPEETFNPNGLDPAWSMVCSRCVEQVVGTKTPVFGGGFEIPSISLSTFTPQPTDYLSPTPSNTPTPTATLPSPTPTPTGGCGWSYVMDFSLGSYSSFVSLRPAPQTTGSGSSWDGTRLAYVDGGSGGSGYYRGVNIQITTAYAGNLDQILVYYDYVKGSTTSGSNLARIFAWSLPTPGTTTTSFSTHTNSCTGCLWNIPLGGTNLALSAGHSWQLRIDSGAGNNTGYYSGSVYIHRIEFYGHGTTNIFTGASAGCPTATPTLTPTPPPTNTPLPGTPSATPEYWATAFPLYGGLSINCEVPKYINLETPVAGLEVGASGESSCYTIIPQVNIGFSAVNFILEALISFSIPDFNVEGMEICFVGISLNVEIFGVQADMAVWLGFPLIAFVFRWVMRN